MKTKIISLAISSLVMVLMGISCSTSKQARNAEAPETGGILTPKDLSGLKKGHEGEALLVYKDTSTDWKRYKNIMVAPVKIMIPEGADESEIKDFQTLANNAELDLRHQLSHELPLVSQAGPDTLVVEMYVYDAEKKKVVLNTVSSVLPIGVVVSASKDFITGKPTSVGEASAQMKATDGQTDKLVAAAQDTRVGQKYSSGTFNSWSEANHAVDYWAKRTRFTLCNLRNETDCVMPG